MNSEADPDIGAKYKFTKFLFGLAVATWILYGISWIPKGNIEIGRGILAGVFASSLMWSTIGVALSVVSAIRDHNPWNYAAGALMLPLSLICWWELMQPVSFH